MIVQVRQRIIKAFILALLLVSPALSFAYVALPIGVETLSKDAPLIFRGICKSERQETLIHPKTGEELPIVVYTFQVGEVVKGEVEGDTFEFPQLQLSYQEALQKRVSFAGREKLECTNKEYLLFLSSPNAMGIRNILGGGQGKLEVQEENQEKIIPLPKDLLKKNEKKEKKILYKNFVDSIQRALQNDSKKK